MITDRHGGDGFGFARALTAYVEADRRCGFGPLTIRLNQCRPGRATWWSMRACSHPGAAAPACDPDPDFATVLRGSGPQPPSDSGQWGLAAVRYPGRGPERHRVRLLLHELSQPSANRSVRRPWAVPDGAPGRTGGSQRWSWAPNSSHTVSVPSLAASRRRQSRAACPGRAVEDWTHRSRPTHQADHRVGHRQGSKDPAAVEAVGGIASALAIDRYGEANRALLHRVPRGHSGLLRSSASIPRSEPRAGRCRASTRCVRDAPLQRAERTVLEDWVSGRLSLHWGWAAACAPIHRWRLRGISPMVSRCPRSSFWKVNCTRHLRSLHDPGRSRATSSATSARSRPPPPGCSDPPGRRTAWCS